jgi:hypothetical protein
MPDVETVDDRVISELRTQIDHQVSGADSMDTRAAALAAATFALFTFTLPHVDVSTGPRAFVAVLVVLLTLAAIGCFARAILPRKEAFAYGVDVDDLLAARAAEEAAFLRAYEKGLRDARVKNETAVQEKAAGVANGLWLLIASGVGLGILLAMGGIHA